MAGGEDQDKGAVANCETTQSVSSLEQVAKYCVLRDCSVLYLVAFTSEMRISLRICLVISFRRARRTGEKKTSRLFGGKRGE